MRKEEKRSFTREETVTTELRCDLCGREAPQPNGWRPWAKDSYDATEVEVALKTGQSYPEGGGGERYVVDICPDCFSAKLIPWLESQGATVREEDWDT